MTRKEQYDRNLKRLLEDTTILKANRDHFKKFFKEREYKLKRINGHKVLDDGNYKTLLAYFHLYKNVNSWLKNKDWENSTKSNIKKVYDDLEDGKAISVNGKVIANKEDYYTKVFKGDDSIFAMIGKDKIAKEVMKYTNKGQRGNERIVRFLEERTFKDIIEVVIRPEQKLLCWLNWDFGENIFSMLQLEKKDFVRRINPENNDAEYILNFRPQILKRSRKARSEISNYPETVKFLDIVLKDLQDNDKLFNFEHRQALKFLKRAVKIIDAKATPTNESVTWKDFRSGMSCHLLKSGWSLDEVKARLGHKPSSDAIDHYANYLALDREAPKKKVFESQINKLLEEIEGFKGREKLTNMRVENLTKLTAELYSIKTGKKAYAGKFVKGEDGKEKAVLIE